IITILIMDNIKELFCTEDSSLLDVYSVFDKAVKIGLPTGIALVTNPEGVLIGTITDGDIRRSIIKNRAMDLTASDIMQKDTIFSSEGMSNSEIIERIHLELEKRNRRSRKFLEKIVLVDSTIRPTRVIDYYQLWERKVASHRH